MAEEVLSGSERIRDLWFWWKEYWHTWVESFRNWQETLKLGLSWASSFFCWNIRTCKFCVIPWVWCPVARRWDRWAWCRTGWGAVGPHTRPPPGPSPHPPHTLHNSKPTSKLLPIMVQPFKLGLKE